MKRSLSALLGAVLLCTVAACSGPAAQAPSGASDYPKKGANLTLLLPVAAGGTTDTVARIVAPALETELGVNIQVVNKPGAEQQLGLTELANSKADGYTIGFTNLPSMVSGYKNKARGATYDRASFTPIGAVAESRSVIAVGADSPYRTLDDIVDAAKAGRVTVGITGGALGDSDLLVRKIEEAAGVEFARVPIGSGAEIAVALAGGQVNFAPGSISTFLPLTQAGKVRMVTVLADEPAASIPDVPVTDLDVNGSAFLAISGPKGLDPGIVTTLNAALEKVMGTEDVRSRISGTGNLPTFMSASDMAAFWEEQDTTIGGLIAKAQG